MVTELNNEFEVAGSVRWPVFFILFAFSLALIYCIITTDNEIQPHNQVQSAVTGLQNMFEVAAGSNHRPFPLFYFCEKLLEMTTLTIFVRIYY